jgi:hypothetical protein
MLTRSWRPRSGLVADNLDKPAFVAEHRPGAPQFPFSIAQTSL